MKGVVVSLAFFLRLASAAGIEQIEHVVLYMQENRAFDHYFGTLAGVRGFKDPNVQVNADGRSVFYQKVDGAVSLITDHLLPWYIAHGGEPGRAEAVQCSLAGSNAYSYDALFKYLSNQAALAAGQNDQWALANTPQSEAYYKRSDLPVHYGIADGWTVADMYQEGVISSTDPNRVYWQTGSINIAGGAVSSVMGPVLDNNRSPGCVALTYTNVEPELGQAHVQQTGKDFSCYPFDWKTVPEHLEDAGVSWKFFQAQDTFGDNPLLFFSQYQDLLTAGNFSHPLVVRGLEYQPSQAESDVVETTPPPLSDELGGLYAFQAAAAAGTLPAVSYIVGPAALSEHAPFLPRDGAWFTRQIVEAVQNSPKYNSTVLMVSYDETGGTADHVVPFHSPEGTPGEWMTNPFTGNQTFAGPGFRLPFLAISPWTRGGNVFTEPADHTSQLLFLEKWLAAKGVEITIGAINEWRREHMSDLASLFDFENPDLSLVNLPEISIPHSTDGHFDGAAFCEGPLSVPEPPYGMQTEANSLIQEDGFKAVRGAITEGRHLTFESGAYALAYSMTAMRNKRFLSAVTAERTAPAHNKANQLIVLEATDAALATGKTFKMRFPAAIGSAAAYLDATLTLADQANAETFTILNQGTGTGYSVQTSAGKYLSLANGKASLSDKASSFKLFAVTMQPNFWM